MEYKVLSVPYPERQFCVSMADLHLNACTVGGGVGVGMGVGVGGWGCMAIHYGCAMSTNLLSIKGPQISKCICPVVHNTPLGTEMCKFLFRCGTSWGMGYILNAFCCQNSFEVDCQYSDRLKRINSYWNRTLWLSDHELRWHRRGLRN